MNKKLQIIVTILFSGYFTSVTHAQGTPTAEAQLIQPPPVTPEVTAAPAVQLQIDAADIVSRRVVVRPEQTFTIEELKSKKLDPLPKPEPKQQSQLSEEEKKARAAQTMTTRFTMFSCTVFRDDEKSLTRSHIKWTSQGKTPVEFYEAWSNVDFRHFAHIQSFNKAQTQHGVMFAMNYQSSAKMAQQARNMQREYVAPTIPELPRSAAAKPSFTVVSGNPAPEDLAAVEGLHELYKKHRKSFIAEYQRISLENARRAAALKANPPDPSPDITIRYWIPESPISPEISEQSPAAKGGDQ